MHLVSPAVVATFTSHENSNGTKTTLLVLWRGSPGWLSEGGRGHGYGGNAGADEGGYAYYWLASSGGLTFTVEFDFARRTAKILNREVSLTETNVVLVDFVDSPNGPTIVGYRWVDPKTSNPAVADPVPAMIQHTPELFEYLQCNITLRDRAMDTMRTELCNQVKPPK